MRTIREGFVPFFADLLSSEVFELPFALQEEQKNDVLPKSHGWADDFAKWIRDPANRKVAQSLIWVGLVFLTMLLSVVLFSLSRVFRSEETVLACGAAGLWGVLFGVAVLFFLPSKTVIAVWGCLLGTSVDKLSTGTGALKLISHSVSDAAGLIASPLSLPDWFTQLILWVFLLTFGLICLPAFFRD